LKSDFSQNLDYLSRSSGKITIITSIGCIIKTSLLFLILTISLFGNSGWIQNQLNQGNKNRFIGPAYLQLPPPVLTYPIDGSTGHPITTFLKWDPLASAGYYELQIATDTNFTAGSTKYTTTTTNSFINIPATILSLSTHYFWRVRGVQEIAGSNYSGLWGRRNFTTSDDPSGNVPLPILIWPVGGEHIYSLTQLLSWFVSYPGGNGLTYEILYSTNSSFETFSFLETLTSVTCSTTISGLSANTMYYWRVRSNDSVLFMYSSYCGIDSFKTDESLGPVTPIPCYPTGNASLYTTAPTLVWVVVSSAIGIKFDVENNSTGVFTGIPTVSDISVTHLLLSGLTGGKTYHWKVRSSVMGQGVSAWSPEEVFSIDESLGITTDDKTFPSCFKVYQNYPNPFNPSTVIHYQIPSAGKVTIELYDLTGRVIKNLLNVYKDAGYYSINVNGTGLSSGTYFYRISENGFVQTKKMLLLK